MDRLICCVLAMMAGFFTGFDCGPAWGQQPELVSINLAGNDSGNALSGKVSPDDSPAISDDGRMVVFVSQATDLVYQTDANDRSDVFVRDMVDHETVLVSANLGGTATGNRGSGDPAISGNGQWVAFESTSTDLVSESTTSVSDIFLRDLLTGTTFLVSVAFGGGSGGNGGSTNPVVSHLGRWVVFQSYATNLVNLTDSNGDADLFVWDRYTGQVSLITVNTAGNDTGSGFSGNFQAAISDLQGETITVVFASTFVDLVGSDNNNVQDVFRRSIPGGPTFPVSPTLSNGSSKNPLISGYGGWIAFTSDSTNLVSHDTNGVEDCFLYDGAGIILISKNAAGTDSGNSFSFCEAVNADRGFVTFGSSASDLVPTDTNGELDVFIREVRPEVTSLVSANQGDTDSANGYSFASSPSSISRKGRFTVFNSFATNLEAINSDAENDVYLRDHCLGTTTLMDPNFAGTGSGNSWPEDAVISRNGRWVVFSSNASDLVAIDTNGEVDVFRTQVQNWDTWGCGALNLFANGFESGGTSAWSQSVP